MGGEWVPKEQFRYLIIIVRIENIQIIGCLLVFHENWTQIVVLTHVYKSNRDNYNEIKQNLYQASGPDIAFEQSDIGLAQRDWLTARGRVIATVISTVTVRTESNVSGC